MPYTKDLDTVIDSNGILLCTSDFAHNTDDRNGRVKLMNKCKGIIGKMTVSFQVSYTDSCDRPWVF